MLETPRTSDEPFAGRDHSGRGVLSTRHHTKIFVWGEAAVEGNRSFPNKQNREYAEIFKVI